MVVLLCTTCPPCSTRIRSLVFRPPPVLITQSCASSVPIKLVPAVVPALPTISHALLVNVPVAPVIPVAPVGPVTPFVPFVPFVPVGPVAPVTPFVPLVPLVPFAPVGPVGPV